MIEEFEKKMKKCGSMSGARQVIGDAEESSVHIEANDIATPSTVGAKAASTSANDAIAHGGDVDLMEVVDDAILADDGRDPIEGASVYAAEASTREKAPSLAIPLAFYATNEGAASIDVIAPT